MATGITIVAFETADGALAADVYLRFANLQADASLTHQLGCGSS
jgi:hypothetical protein